MTPVSFVAKKRTLLLSEEAELHNATEMLRRLVDDCGNAIGEVEIFDGVNTTEELIARVSLCATPVVAVSNSNNSGSGIRLNIESFHILNNTEEACSDLEYSGYYLKNHPVTRTCEAVSKVI